ncbi:MAG: hypothetical protein HYU66_13180 [Armatimonadetes bacterium]|nr:hypothetical protein [Armatimonadota bacterium]
MAGRQPDEHHPHRIRPRADSHVVLSAEGSADVFKTFVEPGGSFSPGVGSYGVSVWVWLESEQHLVAPELLPRDAIRDRLLGGILPIVRSRWRAGAFEVDLRLGVEACPDEHHPVDVLACRVTNRGRHLAEAIVLLVVRSLGPAGGPLRSIAWCPEIRGFLIHDIPQVLGSRTPLEAGCVSLSEDGVSLSELLRAGQRPRRALATDPDGWCGGSLAYHVALEAGGEWEAGWSFPVHPAARPAEPAAAPSYLLARERIETLADQWRERLTRVRIDAPDARYSEAFHASLTHLVMAVDQGEPRIATVCYPLFWTRDCVYILHAFDKAGLHDLARAGMRALCEHPWGGGFGPEADAPGQGLWCLHEHYRLTGDRDWLAGVYPHVRERAEWLLRMLHTSEPIRLPARNVLPRTRLHPEQGLVCEVASHGLIVGRMDGHRPLFWVNAWALAGLRAAAQAARELDREADAEPWTAAADALAAALRSEVVRFGQNERDVSCAVWPTGAREAQDPATVDAFVRWWREHRDGGGGEYVREPRWRYFEVAQAHNLLKLGRRDEALSTIEEFLRTQDAPGLYGWAEGDLTGDPTGDWRLIRGWWPTSNIVPHGWVAAEMLLLLRDLFVFEEGDHLVIGGGLPRGWFGDGHVIGIEGAPTYLGRVSWRIEPFAESRGFTLTIRCEPAPPPGGYRLRLPLPPAANVEFDGAGVREENGDWPIRCDRAEVGIGVILP